MATYRQIQDWVKTNYGYGVKSCWIAHVKEMNGLKLRQAPNRFDDNIRANPCPENKRDSIEQAFKYYKMI